MEPRDQLAANLRRARSEAQLTQEALGDLAGMHATEVSRLERGVRDPRFSTLLRLARALDTPVSELVAGIQ